MRASRCSLRVRCRAIQPTGALDKGLSPDTREPGINRWCKEIDSFAYVVSRRICHVTNLCDQMFDPFSYLLSFHILLIFFKLSFLFHRRTCVLYRKFQVGKHKDVKTKALLFLSLSRNQREHLDHFLLVLSYLAAIIVHV